LGKCAIGIRISLDIACPIATCCNGSVTGSAGRAKRNTEHPTTPDVYHLNLRRVEHDQHSEIQLASSYSPFLAPTQS
jgi:hypothetical protein